MYVGGGGRKTGGLGRTRERRRWEGLERGEDEGLGEGKEIRHWRGKEIKGKGNTGGGGLKRRNENFRLIKVIFLFKPGSPFC